MVSTIAVKQAGPTCHASDPSSQESEVVGSVFLLERALVVLDWTVRVGPSQGQSRLGLWVVSRRWFARNLPRDPHGRFVQFCMGPIGTLNRGEAILAGCHWENHCQGGSSSSRGGKLCTSQSALNVCDKCRSM